ncbi:hypothetical protein ACFOY8_24365 [Thalassospira xianhensis]|uniref:hypothetical protein n=1 Tax=Thalassospira xianhensis TaxID=478503 RepID=UPI0011BFBF28|nr:hypothetical protein [Thalassospira xianhensis]
MVAPVAVDERKAGALVAIGDRPTGISEGSYRLRRQVGPDDPRHRLAPDHPAPNGLPPPKGHNSPVMIHTNFPQTPFELITRMQYRRNDFSTRQS